MKFIIRKSFLCLLFTFSLYSTENSAPVSTDFKQNESNNTGDTLLSNALQNFYAEKYAEAFILFEEYIKTYGDKAVPLRYLGILSAQQGKEDQAIDYFERAITIDPKELEAKEALGEFYFKKKNFEKSKKIFLELIELNESNEVALDFLARIANAEKNPRKSTFYYKKLSIVAEKADNPAYLYHSYANLANYYYTIGDYANAILYFDKTLLYNENNEQILFILGELCRQQGDLLRSNTYLKKLIQVSPKHIIAYKSLIENYYILQDNQSLVIAKQFVKIFSQKVLTIQAIIEEATGQLDVAKQYFIDALEKEPTLLIAKIGLVNIYQKQNNSIKLKHELLHVIFLTQKIQAFTISQKFINLMFQIVEKEKTLEALHIFKFKKNMSMEERSTYYESLEDMYELYCAHAFNQEQTMQLKQAIAYYEEAYRYGNILIKYLPLLANPNVKVEDQLQNLYTRQYQTLMSIAWIYQSNEMKSFDLSILYSQLAFKYITTHNIVHLDKSRAVFIEGLAYFKKENYDMALKLFLKTLDLYQDKENIPANYYFYIGMTFDKKNKFIAAEENLKKAIELDTENPFYLNYLGYMYVYNNTKLEDAKTLLFRALEDDCENEAYLDSIAWLYFKNGDFKKALTYILLAVAQSEKVNTKGIDSVLYFHLAEIYDRLNDFNSAYIYYNKVHETIKNASEPLDVKYIQNKLTTLGNKINKND